MKNCGKNCVRYPDRLKASLYQVKRVNKTFLLKNPYNCKSSNLIYVAIFLGSKEEIYIYIYIRNRLSSERANKYLQKTHQTAAVEEHLLTCADVKIHMFLFFKILQENKSLRKSYEDYFKDKFKPFLKKKT